MESSKTNFTMNKITIKLISIYIILTFPACKSNKTYVPVESSRTEYRNTIQRDSVHLYDSVFIKEKNDTVFYSKYKFLYRNKFITDTIIKSDSIRVPYPVVQTVEINKLTWYQKACIWFTGIILGGLLFYLFFKYRKLFTK